MSFWKKALGYGVAGIGVATGNPVLIGVGGGIVSSDTANESVKQANQQQQQATNQAQGKLDQTYGQVRSDISPYLNVGSGAISSLGQMVGLPATMAPAGATAPSGSPNQGGSVADLFSYQGTTNGVSGKIGAAVSRTPPAVSQQTGSSYVMMQAPNGMTKQIPADQVAHFEQLGAKVVQP